MKLSAPATTVTNVYHHGDLRNALIEVALARLHEQGHGDMSLSDLARSVGVTPAAVYKHFADKAAVWAALAERGFMQLTAAFEQAAPQAQQPQSARAAKTRLGNIGQAYYDFGLTYPAWFQLMFGEGGAAFREIASTRPNSNSSFHYFERALQDLHRLQVIPRRPKQEELWMAWSLVHGATHLAIAQLSTGMVPKAPGQSLAESVIAALK